MSTTPITRTTPGKRLTRGALADEAGTARVAGVRIVHIGLGAFARAHQAWYTARVDPDRQWGIAAFTGRSATAAEELAPQDGLYFVLERSADGDRVELVDSLVEANDGNDVERFVHHLASPATAIVTITITESGYRLRPSGEPDVDDPVVAADVQLLQRAIARSTGATPWPDARPASALGRLLLGLHARSSSNRAPLAIVPCDNIPGNGRFVREGVLGLARLVDSSLATWIEESVSFVSTSVDRITPKTTDRDREDVVAISGWADAAPVVTEPFHDWVLSGDFPAGRPTWEDAGARFVDDIEPFERRKLWLLNGAHSLLAYLGILRGHDTVSAAIGDPVCRAAVLDIWVEAGRHLPEGLDLDAYSNALLERFENGRIEHQLRQIASEGVTKLRVRIGPVALGELESGRPATAAATAIGAWVAFARGSERRIDARSAEIDAACRSAYPVYALVALIDERLAQNESFMTAVKAVAER